MSGDREPCFHLTLSLSLSLACNTCLYNQSITQSIDRSIDHGWIHVGLLSLAGCRLLEHPSISRAHAAFVHHRNGGLWLADLGSTHGTKLNKRPVLPAGHPGTANNSSAPPGTADEAATSSTSSSSSAFSGFYEVRPGDVVRFGESSRLFIVHGPERFRPPELESENRRRVREKFSERAAKIERFKQEAKEEARKRLLEKGQSVS